jgi:aldose sugar dehydrogenase
LPKTNKSLFLSLYFFSVTLLSSSILSNNNNNVLFSFFNYNFHNYNAFAQYSIAPILPSVPGVNDPNLKAQIVFSTSGKGNTSMAFLAPNEILVLEKNTGKVDRIVNGKMLPNYVLDVAVANNIESGLLGIAVASTLVSDGIRYV